MDTTYSGFVTLLRASDSTLASEVSGFTGVSSILAWMQQRNLTGAKVDIIAQDEFHYDFLVRLPDNRWISFGVT